MRQLRRTRSRLSRRLRSLSRLNDSGRLQDRLEHDARYCGRDGQVVRVGQSIGHGIELDERALLYCCLVRVVICQFGQFEDELGAEGSAAAEVAGQRDVCGENAA